MKLFKSLFAAAVVTLAPASIFAVNPYLPLWEYIPDGEPYVFEDPDNPGQQRVYIYGSHDSMIKGYCGREQVVWSAPVDDLNNWRYDGIIFKQLTDANGDLLNDDALADVLYAPDVALVEDADGKKTYYLYPNDQHGGRNGLVAKSQRPDGPFVVCNWSKTNPKATDGVLGFDPAVFVDDDGKVYGYWGFGTSHAAELDPATMATVKPGAEIIENMVSGYQQPGVFRFYEASSMRKIKDKYVFVYSRVTAPGEFGLDESNYTLAYAYSDTPLGPWTYGGTLIDGRGRENLPDGTAIYTATPAGNTHGSIAEIGGKWYVFYHRQAGTDEYSRQAMVAPIEVRVTEGPGGKVEISEAEYTSEGFETDGLKLSGTYPAGIACHYTGPTPALHEYPAKIYSGSYVKATYLNADPAKAPSDIQLGSNPVVNNTAGSVIGYKYFNFDSAAADNMEMVVDIIPAGIDGKVKIMVGGYTHGKGVEVGAFDVQASAAKRRTKVSVPLRGMKRFKGKQPLYFVIESPTPAKSLFDFYNFTIK